MDTSWYIPMVIGHNHDFSANLSAPLFNLLLFLFNLSSIWLLIKSYESHKSFWLQELKKSGLIWIFSYIYSVLHILKGYKFLKKVPNNIKNKESESDHKIRLRLQGVLEIRLWLHLKCSTPYDSDSAALILKCTLLNKHPVQTLTDRIHHGIIHTKFFGHKKLTPFCLKKLTSFSYKLQKLLKI